MVQGLEAPAKVRVELWLGSVPARLRQGPWTIAFSAWFCVEDATCRRNARCFRKAVTSTAPSCEGLRRLVAGGLPGRCPGPVVVRKAEATAFVSRVGVGVAAVMQKGLTGGLVGTYVPNLCNGLTWSGGAAVTAICSMALGRDVPRTGAEAALTVGATTASGRGARATPRKRSLYTFRDTRAYWTCQFVTFGHATTFRKNASISGRPKSLRRRPGYSAKNPRTHWIQKGIAFSCAPTSRRASM